MGQSSRVVVFPCKTSVLSYQGARLKIRIFALAKELDIDSKLLIEYCAKAGIVIKNSALASISPEERDRVLEVMRSGGATTAPAAASAVASPVATPPRD